MSGKISTHVLDTATGRPAAGVAVTLYFGETAVATARTNADGRTDGPLLSGASLRPGTYRIEFAVGDYFSAEDHPDAKAFLDVVPIVFIVRETTRGYHVPLLVTPWSYSTYRGS